MTPKKAKRLERSWAEVFRNEALPLIDEERFAPMYCVDNGRPDLQGGTNIVLGIQGGQAQFPSGLGDRPEVPNLMIFVTDGNDTKGNSLQDIMDASAASGAEIFAVGVGSVDNATLDAIASDPDSDHVFSTSDFSGLLAIVDSIVTATLIAADTVVTVNGGASSASAVAGGTIYDVTSLSPDGHAIRARIMLMGTQIQILTWELS